MSTFLLSKRNLHIIPAHAQMSETDKSTWDRLSETMQRTDFLFANWIWAAIVLGALILLVIAIIAVVVSRSKKKKLAAYYTDGAKQSLQLVERFPKGTGIGRDDFVGSSSSNVTPSAPATPPTVYTDASPPSSPGVYMGARKPPSASPAPYTEYGSMPVTPSEDYGVLPSPDSIIPWLPPPPRSQATLRAREQYGRPIVFPDSPPQYTNIPLQQAPRKLPPKPLPALPVTASAKKPVPTPTGPIPVQQPIAQTSSQTAQSPTVEAPQYGVLPEQRPSNIQYQLSPSAYRRA